MPVRAEDWAFLPAAMHIHRLRRRDGSTVLTLEGAVHNRLWHPAPPPKLRLRFLDESGAPLAAWIAPITKTPRLDAILAGSAPPPPDTTPVPAGGWKSFLIVLEGVPEAARTLDIAPAIR